MTIYTCILINSLAVRVDTKKSIREACFSSPAWTTRLAWTSHLLEPARAAPDNLIQNFYSQASCQTFFAWDRSWKAAQLSLIFSLLLVFLHKHFPYLLPLLDNEWSHSQLSDCEKKRIKCAVALRVSYWTAIKFSLMQLVLKFDSVRTQTFHL